MQVTHIKAAVIINGEKDCNFFLEYAIYSDQEITPIPIRIFPKRSPENLVPFSIIGSKATNTTPTKPMTIPIPFFLDNRSLNKMKRETAVKSGTAAYKSVPIVAVVVLIPKTKNAILIAPNREKGMSCLRSSRKSVFRRKGETIAPAIRKRIKAKLKGGKLIRPIFMMACVAPPKNDANNMSIIALCLSFIEFKQIKNYCQEKKSAGIPNQTFCRKENPK